MSDKAHRDTIAKTRRSTTEELGKKATIMIVGDIHDGNRATTQITGEDVLYHKWSRMLDVESLSSILTEAGNGIRKPNVVKKGRDEEGHEWWMEQETIEELPQTAEEAKELAINLGQAYILLYVTGATDCHIENFKITGSELTFVDWETVTSAYYFKNIKEPEAYYCDSEYNLSEFMLTGYRRSKRGIRSCHGVATNVIAWCKREGHLTDREAQKLMEEGARRASVFAKVNKAEIAFAIEEATSEKSRVIVRATSVYEEIMNSVKRCKSEMEQGAAFEYWRMRLLGKASKNSARNQEWVRMIVEKEIESMRMGCIPLIQAEEVVSFRDKKTKIRRRCEKRIDGLEKEETKKGLYQVLAQAVSRSNELKSGEMA